METKTLNIFSIIYNWIKKMFLRKTNLNINEDNIDNVIDNNVNVVKDEIIFKFKIYDNINGYHINNASFDFNGYIIKISKMGESELNATTISISSKFVNFEELNNIKLNITLIGDDGYDKITLKDIALEFNDLYVNSNYVLYYELTPKKLGLIPIVFDGANTEEYKEIHPYFKTF